MTATLVGAEKISDLVAVCGDVHRASAIATEDAASSPVSDPAPCTSQTQCRASSQVYRHLLITVDEQEFYEGGYPFSLAQVREIVRSVKAVIFPLYFVKVGSMPEPHRHLRLHGTRLLTRLFERNCHREFLPRDEWHAHSRHVAIVTSQLDGFLALRLHDPNAAGEQETILDQSMSNVLSSVPFSLPFDLRVRVLRQLIHLDKEKLNDAHQSWVRVTINRCALPS